MRKMNYGSLTAFTNRGNSEYIFLEANKKKSKPVPD